MESDGRHVAVAVSDARDPVDRSAPGGFYVGVNPLRAFSSGG